MDAAVDDSVRFGFHFGYGYAGLAGEVDVVDG